MTDRAFLFWIYSRLAKVHGEYENVDYMLKLRTIIAATPAEKRTPNTLTEDQWAEVLGSTEGNFSR